jgi:hypothetical protein
MSTLTTHTDSTRATPSSSNLGLCKFNTTSKAIEVSDGSDWLIYDFNTALVAANRYTLELDGAGDYMDAGAAVVTGTSPITMSAWVYITGTLASYDQVVAIRGSTSTGTARMLGFETGGKVAFNTFGSQLTTNTTLSSNTWYHLAATCTGGSAKVYIDGVLKASGSVTYNSVAGSNTLAVGRGGTTEYIPAKIDEVAVWDEVLSDGGVSVGSTASGEIATLYNLGQPGSISTLGTSGPEGWWRMGDGTEAGTGTTIYDMSANSNDGTLSGDAVITAIGSGESIYV